MSSGFVSGGTVDEPTKRDEAWLKVQQQVEEKRKQKLEAARQDNGKSLYEKLQENKAAKQEAFEESIRLKNQFRALNEEEVDFLDSVLESERAKEAALKKETTDQLEAFRKQQEEAEKAGLAEIEDPQPESIESANREQWARKRRREKDREQTTGAKLRKMSSSKDKPATEMKAESSKSPPVVEEGASKPTEGTERKYSAPLPGSKAPAVSLGLGGYDSDSD